MSNPFPFHHVQIRHRDRHIQAHAGRGADRRWSAAVGHHHLGNTVEQIAQLFSELGKGPGFSLDECLVCVEATGLYAHPLLTFAAQHGVNLWLESAVRIKKSIGLQRGKNDKADALRIAVYAAKNQENARLWKPASATLTAVKNLASLRDRLIKSKNQLTVPVEIQPDGRHAHGGHAGQGHEIHDSLPGS
ncbi:transposase [Cytophagaceae bacterium SJW1-29]|uniref:Transposase n=1 Tax=Salmonirosea aquatica TaxID=2654236 RepID=A0A7C9BEG7_9BACT|nr:transposase [Cytophagaceae bacterium SJW1-29]